MAMKLGGSEYELKNVEVLNSTLETRRLFWGLVFDMKFEVVNHLTKLFNFESIPADWQKNAEDFDFCTRFFLFHTKNHNAYSFDLSPFGFKPDVRDTPLLAYFDFIFKNQSEYDELLAKNKKILKDYSSTLKQQRIVKNTLLEIIPDWKTLQTKDNSEWLCKTLMKWAERCNLTDDWCLDFALDCLRNCKVNFIDELDLPKNYILDGDVFFSVWRFYNFLESGTAWRESLIEMIWGKYKDFSRDDKIPDFPYFEYFWTHEVENKTKKIFKISERYDPFSSTEDYFRNLVEGRFLEKLSRYVYHWDLYVGKLKFLTEKVESFQNRVDGYIATNNREAEKYGGKTVSKKDGDKHFRWLIEYQIPSDKNYTDKSYSEIARENGVDVKTVSEAIGKSAHIIGITLRKPKHTGRPKGSKDSDKSLRKLGLISY